MFKTGWKCTKTRVFSREKKSKNAIFFVLWMSLSFVWFKFTHTLCTIIVLNSITIFTRNTIRLHFHFLFMRLSYWWYYPIEYIYRYLHSRRMPTVSQKEEKSEEEKSAKFSNFFYVCPMVYPRQPNRKVNLNIKSSNTKIIWFSRI